MWNRKAAVSAAVVAAVAFMGACSETPPTEPPAGVPEAASLFGGPAPNPQSFTGTLDAAFVGIAQEVAGFAGLYRGEDGALNVMMVPGAQRASAAQIQSALGGSLSAMGIDLSAQPVNIVAATHDFIALNAVREQVRPVLSIDGVVYLDTDEAANLVSVGVSSAAARASVDQALGMLGVDPAMVAIRDADPIIPMQSLRDRVRPVAGGLQINWPGFLCTLGFNVRSPEAPGVHGFVTNSHCTSVRSTVTGTPYWQPSGSIPSPADPNFIGTEVHDLPFFTGGVCPAGRVCRWSDSAGIQYASGIDNAFARIYRTTGMGSITIDPANPMFEITAERPFPSLGDVMHKVGRTTGWTSGTVTGSCVDTNVGGSNITLLCQEHVSAPAQIVGGGDSGSGVFDFFGGGPQTDIRLTGILWGGNAPGTLFVFSAMNEIRFENTPPPGLSYITH